MYYEGFEKGTTSQQLQFTGIICMSLVICIWMLVFVVFQPPRIGGVKVYTKNVRRDEIYMDLDIM